MPLNPELRKLVPHMKTIPVCVIPRVSLQVREAAAALLGDLPTQTHRHSRARGGSSVFADFLSTQR